MAELDNDRLELFERQLADRVTERVRPALFRLYAAVGTAVIVALGYAGWDFIADTKEEIRSEAKKQVEQELKPLIKDAQKAIELSRKDIEQQLGVLDWLGQRAREMTAEVDSQLRDFQPKADTLDDLIDQVAELELKRKEIEARLERARLTATSVEAITTQLKSLAEQVNELNELVPAGASGTSGERDASQKRASTINKVIQEAQSAQEQVVEARTRTTVFFQFAVAPRDQAQAVARALEREGYIVPGEDREQGAEGKYEVRYFHPEDEGAAERLAGDVTRVLEMLDYAPVPQIGVQSLVKYRGKKPSPGVLELWLELPRL